MKRTKTQKAVFKGVEKIYCMSSTRILFTLFSLPIQIDVLHFDHYIFKVVHITRLQKLGRFLENIRKKVNVYLIILFFGPLSEKSRCHKMKMRTLHDSFNYLFFTDKKNHFQKLKSLDSAL